MSTKVCQQTLACFIQHEKLTVWIKQDRCLLHNNTGISFDKFVIQLLPCCCVRLRSLIFMFKISVKKPVPFLVRVTVL